MKTSQRIDWIDYAKAISIFCVILIHAHVPYPIRGLLRVYLIPLFFFLSGIFANSKQYSGFSEFIIHKAKHILIPYLCFNVITYLFWLLVSNRYGPDAGTFSDWWKPLLGIVLGESIYLTHYTPMWFLACLFSTEILYFLIFSYLKETHYWWLAFVGVFTLGGIIYYTLQFNLPWGIDIAFPMLIFYTMGAHVSKPIRSEDYKILKIKYAPLILIGSACVITLIYHLNPGEVKVFINEYGNYFLFYIGAFAGIIFMVMLTRIIEQYWGHIKWLSYIGRNTLIILCLHLVMLTIIKGVTFFVFNLPLEIYESPIIITIVSALDILFLIPIITIINRYFPILIGKKLPYE